MRSEAPLRRQQQDHIQDGDDGVLNPIEQTPTVEPATAAEVRHTLHSPSPSPLRLPREIEAMDDERIDELVGAAAPIGGSKSSPPSGSLSPRREVLRSPTCYLPLTQRDDHAQATKFQVYEHVEGAKQSPLRRRREKDRAAAIARGEEPRHKGGQQGRDTSCLSGELACLSGPPKC